MLLPPLHLLITMTFSTPTRHFTNNRKLCVAMDLSWLRFTSESAERPGEKGLDQ